jgi:hypothetical protein
MQSVSKKYTELDEAGVVKRITDLQLDLQAHGLSNKGLAKTLDEMRRLLENDIPKLRTEISKRTILVQSLNIFLSILGSLLLLFIFLPNSLTHDLLTDFKAKIDFVNSAMSILVGLFVSFVSVSLWAKKQAQNSIRRITDDIHQLVHRIDMYQLGKTRNQILENAEDSSDPRLLAYLNSIFVAIQICGKMAALVYHNSDDDNVTQSARHLEVVSNQKAELVSRTWHHLLKMN